MLSRWMATGFVKAASVLVLGVFAVTATVTIGADTAEARKRQTVYVAKKKKTVRHGRTQPVVAERASSNPRFASIVVDVNTGRALSQTNADALRHPASVTKVMTLYMLFEQLEAGRLSLDSQMPVSAFAAAQAPTKLGLKPGATLRVEDAIMGMVTRSANDAAVVVAETLGGSESNFAAMMTRKARSIGMTRTVYRNASGLPDPGQVTTARDLAVLGISIQDRFPRYYRYFSTRTFVYRGSGIANHNKLLGKVEGVDGIKTGYTRASGFNLLTSVKRDGRQIVAVVLGGTSGGSRDATMRQMIAEYMPQAYAGRRVNRTAVAEAGPQPLTQPAPEPKDIARADVETKAAMAAAAPKPAKVRPAVVAETPKPKAAAPVAITPPKLAGLVQVPSVAPQPRPLEAATPAIAETVPAGPVLRWVEGPAPVTAPASPPARTAEPTSEPPAATATVQLVRTKTFAVPEETGEVTPVSASAAPIPDSSRSALAAAAADTASAAQRSGWIIQIGATDSQTAARKLLDKAMSTNHRAIKAAEPFTESVERNGSTLWRARFAGFDDQRQAQAACAALKSKSFSCLAVRL